MSKQPPPQRNPDWAKNLRSFKKGYDPNRRAGGRPKIDPALRTKAQDWTEEILDRLKALSMGADSDAASISACKLLLAYAWGPVEKWEADPNGPSRVNPIDDLSVTELRSLARQSLAEESAREEAEDDDADESDPVDAEH